MLSNQVQEKEMKGVHLVLLLGALVSTGYAVLSVAPTVLSASDFLFATFCSET